ncbi:hypothetical protein EYF80_029453 [Liparis tanakae]|uniref:Uncharacterized protein n=1 Tax=Liparis tanakae TaxID=230148 RepID=A0A4Z2H346_9TELE|nr:hypothetical protein EYF80_029453 [Liparis tanakae]
MRAFTAPCPETVEPSKTTLVLLGWSKDKEHLVLVLISNHRVLSHTCCRCCRSLFGVGGAAEHLTDRLSDGVAVDAEDPQQLVGLAAAGHLRHGQAVDSEAGLVHDRGAHCLPETA